MLTKYRSFTLLACYERKTAYSVMGIIGRVLARHRTVDSSPAARPHAGLSTQSRGRAETLTRPTGICRNSVCVTHWDPLESSPKNGLGVPPDPSVFLQWQAAGFFHRLWQAGLMEYDEMHGMPSQSIDGSLVRRWQEAVGPIPRIGEKMGAQPAGGRTWGPSRLSSAGTPDAAVRDLAGAGVRRPALAASPTFGAIKATGNRLESSQSKGYTPALQQRENDGRIPDLRLVGDDG
jgi:hypothetical protein